MTEQTQALSDPTPRLYSCFCGKFFTTYPGIYLHLKSKHNHLFGIYKQLKITKLFKKQKLQNGNDLYQLREVDESALQDQVLITPQPKPTKEVAPKQHSRSIQRQPKHTLPARKNMPPPQFPPPPYHMNPMMPPEGMFPPHHHPFMGPPMAPFFDNPSFEAADKSRPFFPMPPLGYPPHFPQITIRSLMEQYFLTVPQLCPRQVTRKVLCDLMHHLDTHYSEMSTNIMKDVAFLSYCCTYGPMLAGSLMRSYGQHKDRSQVESKIVAGFIQWLGANGHQIFTPDVRPLTAKLTSVVEIIDDEQQPNEEKIDQEQASKKEQEHGSIKPDLQEKPEGGSNLALSASFEAQAEQEQLEMLEEEEKQGEEKGPAVQVNLNKSYSSAEFQSFKS